MSKPWYQSITIWSNVALFAVGVAAIADQIPLSAAGRAWLVAVGAVANVAIRVIFTKAAVTGSAQ